MIDAEWIAQSRAKRIATFEGRIRTCNPSVSGSQSGQEKHQRRTPITVSVHGEIPSSQLAGDG
jgi:hypothetical protein